MKKRFNWEDYCFDDINDLLAHAIKIGIKPLEQAKKYAVKVFEKEESNKAYVYFYTGTLRGTKNAASRRFKNAYKIEVRETEDERKNELVGFKYFGYGWNE